MYPMYCILFLASRIRIFLFSLMTASASSSLLLSSSFLRLASFNVGLGLQHKLTHLLQRCHDLTLNIIALQEVGDPSLSHNKFSHYTFIYSPGPSHHQAGVGLLISNDLMPLCRAYHKSSSGRLIGVVLELSKGRRTLIISAYMPSGLDHKSNTDPLKKQAADLYLEINKWHNQSDLIHECIVMGDLNETLTSHDRYPIQSSSSSSLSSKEIHYLCMSNFIDVFRFHYPNASSSPGFTHQANGPTHVTCSRIDYIWTHNIPTSSLIDVHIDTNLQYHNVSHHCG